MAGLHDLRERPNSSLHFYDLRINGFIQVVINKHDILFPHYLKYLLTESSNFVQGLKTRSYNPTDSDQGVNYPS